MSSRNARDDGDGNKVWEGRGEKVMKWKKQRADGDRGETNNGGMEGSVEEDEGTERVFSITVSATVDTVSSWQNNLMTWKKRVTELKHNNSL